MTNVPELPVLSRVEGRVGHVTLNRPEARNAVTIALADGLHDALVDLAGRVAVIVVRGAGGTFSAGGDVDEVARLAAEGPEALRVLFERFGRVAVDRMLDVRGLEPLDDSAHAVLGYLLGGGGKT